MAGLPVSGSGAGAAEVEPSSHPPLGSARLGLVLGALVLALLSGFGLGRLEVGPATVGPATRPEAATGAGHDHPPGTGPHDHPTPGADTAVSAGAVGGLVLSAGGYTLVPETTALPVGRERDFRFRITGPDRAVVTRFAVPHEKPMHLVLVRRDLSGYRHLHPAMAPDGTWSLPLTLSAPGVWRVYLDFVAVDGANREVPLTLGIDVVGSGGYLPRPLPAPARETTVAGFTVSYQGTPQVGAAQPLLFRVFANGRPVTGLERYLGAYGHLVALRDGDLGYLHVHPETELSGGAVKFWLAAPSPGRYRLYFDFQVAGVVRTAEFTMTVP